MARKNLLKFYIDILNTQSGRQALTSLFVNLRKKPEAGMLLSRYNIDPLDKHAGRKGAVRFFINLVRDLEDWMVFFTIDSLRVNHHIPEQRWQ